MSTIVQWIRAVLDPMDLSRILVPSMPLMLPGPADDARHLREDGERLRREMADVHRRLMAQHRDLTRKPELVA